MTEAKQLSGQSPELPWRSSDSSLIDPRYHPRVVQVMVSFRGRVQGVGFRATARSISHSFKVTGWVRNEPDGSVSLLAEGEPDAVEAFLTAIQERMTRFITSIDRQEGQATGMFSRFEIGR